MEYGLAGVVVACVMAMIVAPVIKAIIGHSKESLKLLQKAVQQNTKAIESFQRFESEQSRTNHRLAECQMRILEQLRTSQTPEKTR